MRVSQLFKTKGSFNLLELARSPEKLQEDLEKKPVEEPPEEDLQKQVEGVDAAGLENMMQALAGSGDTRKLEELRRIKEERQRKLAEKLAHGGKKPEGMSSSPSGGEKVQTTIDKLYSLVKKYKKMKIDDKLAHTLGVSKVQIEEWAVILEEHDLIELHYPTIGEPEIMMKEAKEESEE